MQLQQPPIGKDALPVTSESLSVRVGLDLERFYQRLESETIRLINELGQQGLTGKDLADRVTAGLTDLSDSPIEEMGRKSTSEAFNLGRNLAAQDNIELVQEAVRTEILDGNTCEPCRLLDGTRVAINSQEYFEFMPPRHCEGRELCRGFYVFGGTAAMTELSDEIGRSHAGAS